MRGFCGGWIDFCCIIRIFVDSKRKPPLIGRFFLFFIILVDADNCCGGLVLAGIDYCAVYPAEDQFFIVSRACPVMVPVCSAEVGPFFDAGCVVVSGLRIRRIFSPAFVSAEDDSGFNSDVIFSDFAIFIEDSV